MAEVKEVTDDIFEAEVLQSEKVYLVDFWAPWCGPCRAVGPVVAELATEMGDRMNFGKVNTDDQTVFAGKYQISSIPALILFKGGEVVSEQVGFKPKPELQAWIEKYLD